MADPMCSVQYTNLAHGQTATHEILLANGALKQYVFSYAKSLEMPASHAAKFLIDEAWVVTDENGNRIRPITGIDKSAGKVELGPNEVVAQWQELTLRALIIRAQMKPGGEKFSGATKKDYVISFLGGIVEPEAPLPKRKARKAKEEKAEETPPTDEEVANDEPEDEPPVEMVGAPPSVEPAPRPKVGSTGGVSNGDVEEMSAAGVDSIFSDGDDDDAQ